MPEKKPTDPALIVAETIQKRCTLKVLADNPADIPQDLSDYDRIVERAIKTAGWAPFHYDRNLDGMAEPWRVDFLSATKCREIAGQFFDWFEDVKPGNKIPAMLNGCGCLVLVRWLPQFGNGGDILTAKQRQVDEEHLAAAAAYTQNLMLVLTAHGFGTYWSSGGQFRTATMREKIGINDAGRLLAAVFIDYNPADDSKTRLPGKLRARRDNQFGWFNRIE